MPRSLIYLKKMNRNLRGHKERGTLEMSVLNGNGVVDL